MPRRVRDGVELAYEAAGRGPSALVFIHGWCCDSSYFAPQFEHFAARRRVLAVDLRGHGSSARPEQAYTMQGFADDVAWLCDEEGIRSAVAIGHSMGGIVALALAERHPELVRGLAFVDSPILPLPGTLEFVRSFAKELRSPGYRDAVRAFVTERMFVPADDPERRQRIALEMSSASQHVLASAWENLFAYDGARALSRCRELPLLVIDAAQPLADAARLRELAPHAVVARTAGAGHFNQLEVPEQVNAMLERFLVRYVEARR